MMIVGSLTGRLHGCRFAHPAMGPVLNGNTTTMQRVAYCDGANAASRENLCPASRTLHYMRTDTVSWLRRVIHV